MTTVTVSGYQLRAGEGRRPNLLTYVVTANDLSLGKDLAERCIEIQLRRPNYDPDRAASLRRFVEDYRWHILSDIGRFFDRPVELAGSDVAISRWAEWEMAVLSRTGRLADCLSVIAERRAKLDDEHGEADLLADHLVSTLKDKGHDPSKANLLIPVQALSVWLTEFYGRKINVVKVTPLLAKLGVPNLIEKVRHSGGTYWNWVGPDCPVDASREVFNEDFRRRPR